MHSVLFKNTAVEKTLNVGRGVTGVNVDKVMQNAFDAFNQYKKISPAKRADYLETVAGEIEKLREKLVPVANEESNLALARLNGELTRTTSQLKIL
jgi:2,5-dioxopentanoate dehydrogenase